MMTARMQTATGYITVVQEQRFRLVTDDGQGLLLAMAHNAPVEIRDLCRLHKTSTHVIVEYTGEPFSEKLQRWTKGPPPTDPTLQHPHCVYQILRRHYAAYTPEMIERVTGCPKGLFLKVAETLTHNSGRERTTAWCYAVGWTHHTTGVQMIRAAAIVQALLGNIGRPGGGILALRGHSSIQGSTDIPTLYNMLPGYLPQPHARKRHGTFQSYLKDETVPKAGGTTSRSTL